MLLSCGDAAWDAEKIRLSREEDLYRQEMLRLVKDLTYVFLVSLLPSLPRLLILNTGSVIDTRSATFSELENTVEELRGNVINRKTRVNMSDVENMALIMSKSR